MQPNFSWPQKLLLTSLVLGVLNMIHQGVFATAEVSGWLAVLSAAQAVSAAVALHLLRRRHARTALALGLWAMLLLAAVVFGTELLLGHAVALWERLPGYIAAACFVALLLWGGARELTRANASHTA